ncbi:hypothetical protein BX600DRAFT_443083 [Xylariales sp. PMI_506]|nr:hypothetical protein BX600DRAFT_443083 [Xylariales sp. PMI_506]
MDPPALVGQELISSAWEQRSIQVEGIALALQTITLILLVLSGVAICLRVAVRAWIQRGSRSWGWDDTLALLSFLLFIASCIFVILATQYGLGTKDSSLTAPLKARAAIYLGYWQMHYAVSVNLVKAGIATTLLRLTSQRRYRYPLWGILLISPLFTVVIIIILAATCHPVAAQWDLDLGPCSTHTAMAQLSYLFTVFTVILDWFCSIIPYLLLKDLDLNKRTKVSLIGILAMGGFASTAAIIRIPYLKYYLITDDQFCMSNSNLCVSISSCYIRCLPANPELLFLDHFANIVLWSIVENGVGIIAASLPPIRKLLRFYRNTKSESQPIERAGAIETIGGTPFTNRTSTKLRALSPKPGGYDMGSSGQWNHLGDASSSQEVIIESRSTHTTKLKGGGED